MCHWRVPNKTLCIPCERLYQDCGCRGYLDEWRDVLSDFEDDDWEQDDPESQQEWATRFLQRTELGVFPRPLTPPERALAPRQPV